ncbi:MAG: cytochrome c3 family protein [Bacteroidales bacterium]
MKMLKSHLSLFLILILLSGCSPRSSYLVMSFFFDGVPDYTKKQSKPLTDSVRNGTNPLLMASLPVKAASAYILHKPYSDRNCTSCHDKGINNTSLKEQPGMCYSCHKDFALQYKYVHGPAAGGYCSSCHHPHKGVEANLLKTKGQDLCYRCHVASDILQNISHKDIGSTDCINCHNPHGGADRFVLK